MDIIDAPFLKFSPDDLPRPWLPLTIKNPHTNQVINVYGLIDTGADECAIPAYYASMIGHSLQAGTEKFHVHTGNLFCLMYRTYDLALVKLLARKR